MGLVELSHGTGMVTLQSQPGLGPHPVIASRTAAMGSDNRSVFRSEGIRMADYLDLPTRAELEGVPVRNCGGTRAELRVLLCLSLSLSVFSLKAR
jgi:hypothetical protein